MGRRRAASVVGMLFGVYVALGIVASGAAGATYHVYSCHDPDGNVAPTDGWSGSASGPDADAINDCAGTTTYALTAALDGAIPHATNTDFALWSFSVDPGLSIEAASLYRREATPGGVGTNAGYVTAFYAPNFLYDAGDVFDDCEALQGCSAIGGDEGAFGASNHEVVPAGNINGASHLYMSADCGGAPSAVCPAYPGGYAAIADIYAADLTLEDDTDPTSSNVGGPLVAGGTLSGAQDITFDAADTGSGVYSASVIVDGTTVSNEVLDPNGGRCQTVGQATDGLRDFLYQVPCKTALSADVSLDTSQLTDGSHSLRVTIDDAAGNTATVYSGTITTHNAVAPVSAQSGGLTGATPPAAGPTGPTGPTGTGAGPASVANGTGACANATLTAEFGSSRAIHVGLKQGATLTGTLSCAGHGVGGATIGVSVTTEDGAGPTSSGQVTTGPGGTFSDAFAAGPSRVIKLSYQAFSGDVGPSATATADLLVRPSISLTVLPTHTRNGHTITYRGRVYGGHIPTGGLTLNVEYLDGSRWRAFDQTKARGEDGSFVYRYTFRRTTIPIIYTFRVAIPGTGEAGYPYEATASRRRSVRVDP
jgi:hypothetical protein